MDKIAGAEVYIADIKKILPNRVTTKDVVDILYSKQKGYEVENRFAHRIAGSVGVKTRYTILDPEALPHKKLADDGFSPLAWGNRMVTHFSEKIDLTDIGFLSVSYNISSHTDVLPNLACKIAADNGLNLDSIPEEISYYGCASGIFSLNSAVEYCRTSKKAMRD